jgi:hypothetical protein
LERLAAQAMQAAAALVTIPAGIADSTRRSRWRTTVTVVPAGAQLPASFAAQKWEAMPTPKPAA